MTDGGILPLARALEGLAKGSRARVLLNPAALGGRPTERSAHGLRGGVLVQQRLYQIMRCLHTQQPWWLAASEQRVGIRLSGFQVMAGARSSAQTQ